MMKRVEGAGLLRGFRLMVDGVKGYVSHIFCLRMIRFRFVIQMRNKF